MPHTPVLQQQVINGLNVIPGDTVVDMTVGNAGHSKTLCKRLKSSGQLIGIDQDEDAAEAARAILKDECSCKTEVITANFRDIKEILDSREIEKIDKVLFDLGLRSDQLETSGRGFSFQKDEPLIMTFKKHPRKEDLTAWEIVNTWEEENIADVLYGYGEERYSRQIASGIVESRETSSIDSTSDLVEIIKDSVPNRYLHGRIHPATRTFQALRIAVNDELRSLENALNDVYSYLSSGGRIAVISFHSLEDRIVKHFFKARAKEDQVRLLSKKPTTPTEEEIETNPRSRSAKLRICEKI